MICTCSKVVASEIDIPLFIYGVNMQQQSFKESLTLRKGFMKQELCYIGKLLQISHTESSCDVCCVCGQYFTKLIQN